MASQEAVQDWRITTQRPSRPIGDCEARGFPAAFLGVVLVLMGYDGIGFRDSNLDVNSDPLSADSQDPNGEKWDSSYCPFNEIADPPGSTPMYQVVEEYADSNEKFFADFYPTLEKMLMNGYTASDLVVGPMASHACPYQDPYDWSRYYSC